MPTTHLILLALSFYTRIPCPQNLDYKQLPQATVCLPLVGWLVGAVLAFSFYLANLLWPQQTAIIIAIIVGILLTGAFHEDGFADSCDGFGGGYGKPRILDIMKDPHIGTYGALGLMLLILLKISALSSIPASTVPYVFIASHSLSRFAPLYLMYRHNYARLENSKTGAAMYKPSLREIQITLGLATFPLLFLPLACLWVIVPLWLSTHLLGRYFYRHIGGYTGDCLGASQQVAETVFYLSVSALWTFI
jgi:adenosylcobinamide-GDP ribazoletransferase